MSKNIHVSFGRILLIGARASVFLAVAASQLGERVLRGARGFAVYRQAHTERA
jgi:hypothetical protein